MIFAAFIFCSGCTSEITITAKSSNSIEVTFNGAAGKAFAKLINSAAGEESDSVIFDLKQISYELAKNGFSNVKASSQNGMDLRVAMEDNQKASALFSSNILTIQKGKINAWLSPQKLKAFYSSSDEQIAQFLDLLLSPVFNDEVMSEDEYIETIASFYGDDAATEINETNFKITLINLDGSRREKIIPLAKLLSLNEELSF